MAAQLPSVLARFADEQGRPTREFYEWCQKIEALYVSMQTFGLGDLADVDLTGVTDGQQLTYDDGTGTWVPDTA